ncbi:MAG: hypothetical protein AMXMBFR58_10140 [Phycisphaerae bacterium]
MSTSGPRTRNAWEDRFRTPTFETLRDLSNKQVGAVFETARQRLLALGDVTETLAWLGIPWRWSLEYRSPLDPSRAWVVLVLQPNKPEIVVPLPAAVLTRLPLAKLPRTIREGLRAVSPIAGVYWPGWECQTKTQVDEVMQVIELKRSIFSEAQRG